MLENKITSHQVRVIAASSVGTLFEWYDFYLYGSLASIIAKQFFTNLDPGSAFIFALLAFSVGFIFRPIGALIFGPLGDLLGRKYTMLMTMFIMGISTFLVGVLPNYSQIGIIAPICLIILRILQGLALGGEYGGAATYIAEHAPDNKRGLYTSWIQTTATLGLLLSIAVILGTQKAFGAKAFSDWAWRVPFLLSSLLLIVSMYIRLSLTESPVFQKIKEEQQISKSPLRETIGKWENVKIILLALLGLTAGQAVVFYTSQFYALFFMTQYLKVDSFTANSLLAIAIIFATPFYILSGAASDKIGRKKIIMLGCLLATFTYIPSFKMLTAALNPDLDHAQKSAKVFIEADLNECSFQFNPTGTVKFTSSCDIAKQVLASNAVAYKEVAKPAGTIASILIGNTRIEAYSSKNVPLVQVKEKEKAFKAKVAQELKKAKYPEKADPHKINKIKAIAILWYLILLVTLVYGPIAALLVELFPTQIRYTAMSIPYHVGNGWFGGLTPTLAFAITAQTGDIYKGLYYPIFICAMTFVIGCLLLKEKKFSKLTID